MERISGRAVRRYPPDINTDCLQRQCIYHNLSGLMPLKLIANHALPLRNASEHRKITIVPTRLAHPTQNSRYATITPPQLPLFLSCVAKTVPFESEIIFSTDFVSVHVVKSATSAIRLFVVRKTSPISRWLTQIVQCNVVIALQFIVELHDVDLTGTVGPCTCAIVWSVCVCIVSVYHVFRSQLLSVEELTEEYPEAHPIQV